MRGHHHLTKTLVLSNPYPHLLERKSMAFRNQNPQVGRQSFHHFAARHGALGFNEHSFAWKVQLYSDLLKIDLILLQFPRALPGTPQPNSSRPESENHPIISNLIPISSAANLCWAHGHLGVADTVNNCGLELNRRRVVVVVGAPARPKICGPCQKGPGP